MKKIITIIFLLVFTICFIMYIPQCIRIIERNMEKEEEKFVEDVGKVLKVYYGFLDDVTALCEDTTEDKNIFLQKFTDLLKEQETWKEKNKDMHEAPYIDLIQLFDSVLLTAIYNIRRSLETDTNPITKDKKITALTILTSKVDPKQLENHIKRLEEEEKKTNQKENS